MIPPNWHIVDDESIMELMAEALRDARQAPVASGDIPETSEAPTPQPTLSDRKRWQVRLPAHVIPVLASALFVTGWVSIPVLFFVFDAAIWPAFVDVCNTLFTPGSGDVWAMQWIGWSQRNPMGLLGVFLAWIACGGAIILRVRRKNAGNLFKDMIESVLKRIHEMRHLLTRDMSKASRVGER